MNKALLFFSVLPCLVAPHLAAQGKKGSTMSLQLTSTAFAHGGEISSKYTCDGQDTSPPLAWSGIPPKAKSLVLIVDDPDAIDMCTPARVRTN